MHLSVYVALAAALLLTLTLRPVTRRLAPKPAAVVAAAGSITAGLVWAAGLGLLAAATLARLQPVGDLGRWSVSALDARDPVPLAAGVMSLVILLGVAITLARAIRRLAQSLREIRRLRQATFACRCEDLAVLNDPAPQAFALPGWPGRAGNHANIVVTSGMLQALDPAERRVLLAHERTHVRNGHWVYRVATRLGAALLPVSMPLIARCDQSLERWADEQAAHIVGDRLVAATAVAKAALATTDHHRSTLAPAFAAGAVAERVEALLAPANPSRWTPVLLVAGIALAAVATLLHAGHDLHSLLALARYLGRP